MTMKWLREKSILSQPYPSIIQKFSSSKEIKKGKARRQEKFVNLFSTHLILVTPRSERVYGTCNHRVAYVHQGLP